MTLCIAALCQADDGPRAVLSLDSRIETNTTTADTELKMEDLTDDDDWVALLAGNDLAQARELASVYSEFLDTEAAGLTYENALPKLRKPANKMRRRLADSYTQKAVSMKYSDFLADGKDQLPEFIHQNIVSQVAKQYIDAQLILVGWLDDIEELVLFVYDGYSHRLARELDFAVIGSGSTIASVSLFHRAQSANNDFERTLYAVYEAQRDGRFAPGVGDYFKVAVVRREESKSKLEWLTEEGEERLGVLYERLERGFIPDKIELPENAFSPELDFPTIIRV